MSGERSAQVLAVRGQDDGQSLLECFEVLGLHLVADAGQARRVQVSAQLLHFGDVVVGYDTACAGAKQRDRFDDLRKIGVDVVCRSLRNCFISAMSSSDTTPPAPAQSSETGSMICARSA
jgi:hypothetical protein